MSTPWLVYFSRFYELGKSCLGRKSEHDAKEGPEFKDRRVVETDQEPPGIAYGRRGQCRSSGYVKSASR